MNARARSSKITTKIDTRRQPSCVVLIEVKRSTPSSAAIVSAKCSPAPRATRPPTRIGDSVAPSLVLFEKTRSSLRKPKPNVKFAPAQTLKKDAHGRASVLSHVWHAPLPMTLSTVHGACSLIPSHKGTIFHVRLLPQHLASVYTGRFESVFLHGLLLDTFQDLCPTVLSNHMYTAKYDDAAFQDADG